MTAAVRLIKGIKIKKISFRVRRENEEEMRAINSLILHILIFEFFQFIRTDQIEEPSFVASNQFDEPLVTSKCFRNSFFSQI